MEKDEEPLTKPPSNPWPIHAEERSVCNTLAHQKDNLAAGMLSVLDWSRKRSEGTCKCWIIIVPKSPSAILASRGSFTFPLPIFINCLLILNLCKKKCDSLHALCVCTCELIQLYWIVLSKRKHFHKRIPFHVTLEYFTVFFRCYKYVHGRALFMLSLGLRDLASHRRRMLLSWTLFSRLFIR